MIAAVRRAWESFRGIGEAAVTVPPMDGALRPNQDLEQADLLAELPQPDDVAVRDDRVIVSSGNVLLALTPSGGGVETVNRYDSAVTAFAVGPDGSLAAGLDDGRIVIRGTGGEQVIDRVGGRKLVCPTALLFEPDGGLVIAEGSASRRPSSWKHDAMERASTGSVWRVPLRAGEPTKLGGGLAWPAGLASAGDGAVAVTESWRHRIVVLGGGAPRTVLADLPGYPARLRAAADGGYWLTVFAPRNQLIEFVQREPEFLRRMMAEVDPDYWVAPSLTASKTFLVPLQGGAQKHLGMLKPWAPTYSYGLVVKLDRQFRPVASHHSRADGRRHGITGCVEFDGRLVIASKGGDAVLSLGTGE